MKTKKILVPFDMNLPNKKHKGFLCPNIDLKEINSFFELSTAKVWNVGMVVFIGKEITKDDIFSRIVDSGKKINSASILLNTIEEYIIQINNYKIGDLISVRPVGNSFELIKIQKK